MLFSCTSCAKMKKVLQKNLINFILQLVLCLNLSVFIPWCDAAHQTELYGYGSNEEYSSYKSYQVEKVVDSKGRYTLGYTVDYQAKIITFNLTVKTTGWVGVGLSKDGTMKEADIMIGWVDGYNRGYAVDFHADYNRKLQSDTRQNWKLLESYEKNGVTNLVVSRPLDTCDPQDYPITIDLVWILWAYGETDDLTYHFDKRGSFRAYLLDLVVEEPERYTHLEFFRVSKRHTLKRQETSYLCSIHKGPHLLHKHHMVKFRPYFENELSHNHAHHMIIYLCVAPPGMDAKDIFEPLLDYPGEECYFNEDRVIPIQLCRVIVGGWAVGGENYSWPYSTGVPMGESFDEYYMQEVHYDNPELQPLTVTSGLDIFYTNKLRSNDGGTFFVNYDLLGMFIVPPISTYFEVYSFCTEECTRTMTPEAGYEILGVLLHTHLSGIRVKLQHFRDGKELAWIVKDDNYDHRYQPVRFLYEPRKVLPGDLLAFKCEYDNTWTNRTVLSGFAKREEMCTCNLLITKRLPYYTCCSQIPQEHLLPFVGAEKCVWDLETQERIVTEPEALDGKLVSTLCDKKDWTKSQRYKLQEVQLKTISSGSCPQILVPTSDQSTATSGVHHHHHHHLKERSTNDQQEQQASTSSTSMQHLLGTIISSSHDTADILTLAKGYGETTTMGEAVLPNRMSGPLSTTQLPSGNKYLAVRTCPRLNTSPFLYTTAAQTQTQNNGYSSTNNNYQSSSYSTYPVYG